MPGLVERAAYAGDVAGDAGRGLIVAGEHGLDLVAAIGGKDIGIALDRDAFAPIDIDEFDLETVALTHVDPEMGKLAEARGEDLLARRERVGERRFPPAGAGGGEQEDLTLLRLEDLLHVLEERKGKLWQVRCPLVLHGNVHRA